MHGKLSLEELVRAFLDYSSFLSESTADDFSVLIVYTELVGRSFDLSTILHEANKTLALFICHLLVASFILLRTTTVNVILRWSDPLGLIFLIHIS